ncbi:hypothetical protein [Paucibacter sp. M5-1]|uniref:hypothetical protein n=1 Tax=Paucibacter sp. M5-1 TaxID=3015998 RepID=UPI0022B8FB9B|nr:hypothetical protein [Paucibacter sp. M5-1]MCZ7881243.1 hypothetical protein [Paucibacter sp. M5-1]
MKTARRKTPTPDYADPLKHFSRDGPITRLIVQLHQQVASDPVGERSCHLANRHQAHGVLVIDLSCGSGGLVDGFHDTITGQYFS